MARALEPGLVQAAVEALDRGELVVYPTDTLYGLGADALNPEAVVRVFEAKGRPRSEPLSVAVAGLDMMQRLVRVGPLARGIAERFLPGPLTLVLPPLPGVPDELLGRSEGLGVRVPRHPVALELCARFGPLTATSANLHGGEEPRSCGAARRQLGARAALYLDAGPAPLGRGSTVLDLTGARPRLVREGALPAGELEPWLSPSANP